MKIVFSIVLNATSNRFQRILPYLLINLILHLMKANEQTIRELLQNLHWMDRHYNIPLLCMANYSICMLCISSCVSRRRGRVGRGGFVDCVTINSYPSIWGIPLKSIVKKLVIRTGYVSWMTFNLKMCNNVLSPMRAQMMIIISSNAMVTGCINKCYVDILN